MSESACSRSARSSLERARLARIIARGLDAAAAQRAPAVLEAADVVALPAVEREGDVASRCRAASVSTP